MPYVIAPPAIVSLPVVGCADRFPVRRVYCVGRNYVEHAQEMGFSGREAPFFFMKPADAVLPCAPGETVEMAYPTATTNLHHEVELVVAIAGPGGRDIAPERAHEHVFGYAVGLDMTRRDRQGEAKKQGRPWEIGKAFDGSAPIGAIVPAAQCGELLDGPIELRVNDRVAQSSDIAKMIWGVRDIIAHLSAAWALSPGDLIMTGTPEGVGAVAAGDVLLARCAMLPELTVRVR